MVDRRGAERLPVNGRRRRSDVEVQHEPDVVGPWMLGAGACVLDPAQLGRRRPWVAWD